MSKILPMVLNDQSKATVTSAGVGTLARKGMAKEDESFKEVMHRWGQGKLHAGPGGKNLAESQEQALAIAFNIAEDK